MNNRGFVIVGAGGHCRTVIECLESSGRSVKGILDLDYSGRDESILGVKVVGPYTRLRELWGPEQVNVVLGIGDNEKRKAVYREIKLFGYSLPLVAHSASNISKSAIIRNGCLIGPGCIINAEAVIGENTIINTGAIIEHEVRVGINSHICPGVAVAGRVVIGKNSFVGIGARVIERVRIGDNVCVGAGSVVLDDVKSDCVVAGIPAKAIK